MAGVRIWNSVLIAAFAVALTGCTEPLPVPATEPGPTLRLDGGVARLDLRFACGTTQCAGWLFLPASPAPAPVVVMGHGFAGTRDVALPWIAERFASAGIAAFLFDYRHFGASGGAPRQLVDPWRQLEDWAAALAFVRTRADVDATRVALWGSSMGGGHALIAATRDGRVRGVVAQAPLIDTGVEGEATFPGIRWAIRLLFSAWADLAASSLGGEPVTMPAIAPAAGFGMIVDDAAHAAFERLVERDSTYRNEVAARSVLTFDEYDPALQAASIAVPVLLIASRSDRFAPFSAVEAFARPRPNVAVEIFEGDHFDVYASPVRERATEFAIPFLSGLVAQNR